MVNIKEVIKAKYGEIASQSSASGCCTCGCGEPELYNIMTDEYANIEGYVSEADLGLGCGIPMEFAGIKEGHTVLDLGSGAGNDAFIISKIVGKSGKVIGVDMTEEMLEKANSNKAKLGFDNVEFKFGEIEELPLESQLVDVVVSNCVINLVPDKKQAFSEIFRVLKPGGSFCVSDIVLEGELPEKINTLAVFYTGCVSGASQMKDYIKIIEDAGFSEIKIHKKKEFKIPEEMLFKYLNKEDIDEFYNSRAGIFSITISAKKL